MIKTTIALLLATSVALLTAACGAAVSENETISETDLAEANSLPAKEVSAQAPGTIARADLDAVIKRGPAALLAEVQVERQLAGGKFAGWKIVGFAHGPPADIDVRLHDVVTRVNGREVERPEQFSKIFEELKVASEVRFELLRDGEPVTLSYPVVE